MVDRHRSDETAVTAVIAVVAHDKDIAFRNGDFPLLGINHLFVRVRFVQHFAVPPYVVIMKGQLITGAADDAFYPNVFRLELGIEKRHIVIHGLCHIILPRPRISHAAVDDDDIPVFSAPEDL